jgi:hypothetical protein
VRDIEQERDKLRKRQRERERERKTIREKILLTRLKDER